MFENTKTKLRPLKRIPSTVYEYFSEYKSKLFWKNGDAIHGYRNKIKVYDFFTFFNELDLLEIRLNILDAYADYFVISESNMTFSGQKKPMHFAENKERYARWAHKIIYIPILDAPTSIEDLKSRLRDGTSKDDMSLAKECLNLDFINKDFHWIREYYIKEYMRYHLPALNDNDICYISDLDEIWDPTVKIDFSRNDIYKLILNSYIYFLNNRTNEHWRGFTGPVVSKYKWVKQFGLNVIRTHKLMYYRYTFLHNAGWHFSFQGGLQGATKKIVDSAHTWYKPEETLPNLEERIKQNLHYRGRKDIKIWVDERGLPEYLLNNRDKYKSMFR